MFLAHTRGEAVFPARKMILLVMVIRIVIVYLAQEAGQHAGACLVPAPPAWTRLLNGVPVNNTQSLPPIASLCVNEKSTRMVLE